MVDPSGEALRDAGLGVPHAFLDAAASDARNFSTVPHPAGLVLLKQVHSARVCTVDAPFAEGERPEADGMASATPGLALGIVTADCAPVLLADTEAGVIGAAHAGWRGAHTGVLEATVRHMVELGAEPSRIVAAIGPCIAPESYEIGFDMRERFDEERYARFFLPSPRPAKWQFDLPGYVASRLAGCGVGSTGPVGGDTYAQAERFHSYRRATHAGTPNTGRQYSLIALPPA